MIKSVKKVTARPAFNILECDGENLQAHIAASMSNEPKLRELFTTGGDFHSTNAYTIMGKYTSFFPFEVTYTDGTSEQIMEWESFNLERGQHIETADLKPGDVINEKTIQSVTRLPARQVSFEEFSKNAKKGRCKELRTIGKFCGFGFLFGMSASAFASGTLRIEWTPEKCDSFIKEMNLESFRTELAGRYLEMSDSDVAYLTVASFFRREFFSLYPVLEKWIPEQGAIAARDGYVRSPWGARRLLPQLTYQGRNSNSKEVKNLDNIAVNSPVQNYEAVYMAKAMIGVNNELEKNGFQTYIAGTVHDSIVPFTFVEEQDEVLKIMLSYFAIDYPAANGIPYSGECNVADVSKGFIWGYGDREVKLEEVKDVEVRPRKYF